LRTGAERTSETWATSGIDSNGRHFADAIRASAGQSGQEDVFSKCSQEAKVIADHFARTTSVLRNSTVLSVFNAVCDSGPMAGEFWSDE